MGTPSIQIDHDVRMWVEYNIDRRTYRVRFQGEQLQFGVEVSFNKSEGPVPVPGILLYKVEENVNDTH